MIVINEKFKNGCSNKKKKSPFFLVLQKWNKIKQWDVIFQKNKLKIIIFLDSLIK